VPHEIVSATVLVGDTGRTTTELWVHAPDVVPSWKAGQFVIVRTDDNGERIPLTVVGVRPADGTIRLVVQEIGKSTGDLVRLTAGDTISDVCGPLGMPSEIKSFGTCVAVAGGYGSAAVLPIIADLAAAGNRVIGILGARTADLLILVPELEASTHELHIATDDGTSGRRGMVLDPLRDVLAENTVDRVLAIGPTRMMQAVAELTRPAGIPTVVSLNPIMVDGTGMCGACRVHADGKTRFACVDGPEFDAHTIDYEELTARLGTYTAEERVALEESRG